MVDGLPISSHSVSPVTDPLPAQRSPYRSARRFFFNENESRIKTDLPLLSQQCPASGANATHNLTKHGYANEGPTENHNKSNANHE